VEWRSCCSLAVWLVEAPAPTAPTAAGRGLDLHVLL
jgi:hypothetical protein